MAFRARTGSKRRALLAASLLTTGASAAVACFDFGALSAGDAACKGPGCVDASVEDAVVTEDAVVAEGGPAPSTQTFDVVVVGAGPGGIGAAIQASRLGRTVALLEESGQIGGSLLTSTCLDDTPELRADGLYAELLDKLAQSYAKQSPPKAMGTCAFSASSKAYEPGIGAAVLRAWLSGQGGPGLPAFSVVTGARVTSVSKEGPRVVGVVTEDGTTYRAVVVIDATEYGDLLPLAGAAYRVGNAKWDPAVSSEPPAAACVQPLVHPVAVRRFADFATMPPGLDLRALPGGADYATATATFARFVSDAGATSAGAPFPWSFPIYNAHRGTPDTSGASYTAATPAQITKSMLEVGADWPELAPSNGLAVAHVLDPAKRRDEECRARLRAIQLARYVQSSDGLGEPWAISAEHGEDDPSDACAATVPSELAPSARLFAHRPLVREGRRVVGMHTLTAAQILRTGPATMPGYGKSSATSFTTSLVVGYGVPELRGCYAASTLESAELGELPTHAPGGVAAGPFQIPFATFVPKDVDGLLVVDKNLSVSRQLTSVLASQPLALITGQAAGTIAALAAQRQVPPRGVAPFLVQRQLVLGGVEVARHAFTDVPRGHPRWADVQLAAAYDMLRPQGSALGVDDALTREQVAIVLQRAFRYALAPPATPTFADMPASHPSYAFVEGLAAQNITMGCAAADAGSALYFCPDLSVTRAQLALFIARALAAPLGPTCSTAPYPDVLPDDTFCTAVEHLKALGIVVECTGGKFCPNDVVTRGETASFLVRAVEQMAAGTLSIGACHRTAPKYCDE